MADPDGHLKKYQWPKGVSGNPNGRPEGTISPKQRIIAMFKENPETFDEWLEDYITDPRNRKHVVELLDGKPHQSVDLTTMGKELPTPILNVFADLSHNEDNEDEEKDSGSAGGNLGE